MAYTEWGYTHTYLSPSREAYHSEWGKAVTTIEASRDAGNSEWAVINFTVRNPHLPIGILLPGNVMKYVPIHTLMSDDQLR